MVDIGNSEEDAVEIITEDMMYYTAKKIVMYECNNCGDSFEEYDLTWYKYASDKFQSEGWGYACENCINRFKTIMEHVEIGHSLLDVFEKISAEKENLA